VFDHTVTPLTIAHAGLVCVCVCVCVCVAGEAADFEQLAHRYKTSQLKSELLRQGLVPLIWEPDALE
jgi:hypothetical protein